MERTKVPIKMQLPELNIDQETAIQLFGNPKRFIVLDARMLILYEPNTVLFLANLIQFFFYLKVRNKNQGNFFYCTHEQQQKFIKLSEHKIRQAKKELISDGILETKLKGNPVKEWYFINFKLILQKLLSVGEYEYDENQKGLRVENFEGLRSKISTPLYIYNNNIYSFAADGSSEEKDTYISNSPNKPILNTLPINSPNGKISPEQFNKFWNDYPKHAGKGDALIAWNKLCKQKDRPTWRIIKTAILDQKESEQWQEPKFIPNASTWLNNCKWLNDSNEMKNWGKEKDNKPHPNIIDTRERYYTWDQDEQAYFRAGHYKAELCDFDNIYIKYLLP